MFGVNAIPNFYIQNETLNWQWVSFTIKSISGKCFLENVIYQIFFAICGSWLVDKYIFKDNDIYIIGRSEIPASYSL